MNRRGFLSFLTAAVATAVAKPILKLPEFLPKVKAKPILPSGSSITTACPEMEVGDVFTIGGVYKVNPITKENTGVLQQFVCIQKKVAASPTLEFFPPIIDKGQYQNCQLDDKDELAFRVCRPFLGPQYHSSKQAVEFRWSKQQDPNSWGSDEVLEVING